MLSIVREQGFFALAAGAALTLGNVACGATIPAGRVAVGSLDIAGLDTLDDDDLRDALATQELYDQAVFERDLERVERWLRARGHYHGEVVSVAMDPPQLSLAAGTPTPDQQGDTTCQRDCEVDIAITVVEGPPVVVSAITVGGADDLPGDVRDRLLEVLAIKQGERFDERSYDRSKKALAHVLGEAGYAHALVAGRVDIDPEQDTAEVHMLVDAGPLCEFGPITVEPIEPGPDCEFGDLMLVADQDIPLDVIRETALLEAEGPGTSQRFSSSRLAEAQRAIYALGAFSSVEVIPEIPEDRNESIIPVTIKAEPGRVCRFGIGVGFLSGVSPQLGTLDNTASPRWDIHLSASAEARNFLGGLRTLRIEERPRIIFRNQFPSPDEPTLGNTVRLEFRQPYFFEPRTTLVVRGDWDVGPDPFEPFFRHVVDATVGPERLFFDGRLFAAVQLGGIVQIPTESGSSASAWETLFAEQVARLDLRDQPTEPTSGFYAQLELHESLPGLSSWDYVRIAPEVRGYLPLPGGLVLAGRWAMGALIILDFDGQLDQEVRRLGPNQLRLRGGGPTGNRGYLAGQLGDSGQGGLRRWDASLELRIPVADNFIVAVFVDAGDVHSGVANADSDSPGAKLANARFRFDAPHISPGLGVRYRTPVGPIRLDLGWSPAALRSLSDRVDLSQETPPDLFGLGAPLALHITVGEAF